MSDQTMTVHKTLEELEQAIHRYRTTDLTDRTGSELILLWQTIRELSLQVSGFDQPGDGVTAEHSY
jgi:hypothetical protein